MGHIQTTTTILIFVKKIINSSPNSSLECLLSKTFGPQLGIPNRSKVIVEMGTEGHISTKFPKRLWFVNNKPLTYFFLKKFDFEMIDLTI